MAGLLATVMLPLVAVAVICADPFAWPVTSAVADPVLEVALTESKVATARLFDAKVIVTPPMSLPSWSLAWAVNRGVSPTPIVAVAGGVVPPGRRRGGGAGR